jgi:putative ABC transport system ATP-binding protein
VAIAQALVTDPLLLLADEPASNLDQPCRDTILRLLGRLSEARRVAVIMTTRDPETATYANRALRFVDGRIEGDVRKAAGSHAA